jgi:hypothetical protein
MTCLFISYACDKCDGLLKDKKSAHKRVYAVARSNRPYYSHFIFEDIKYARLYATNQERIHSDSIYAFQVFEIDEPEGYVYRKADNSVDKDYENCSYITWYNSIAHLNPVEV